MTVLDRVEARRLPELLALFAHAWWAASRDDASISLMLEGSTVIVALVDDPSEQLVAFARAITDGAFLAVVLDVIVAPRHRGLGLGGRLMQEILARPELANVDSVELVCQPDVAAFYRRVGFTTEVGHSILMRRTANPLLAP